MFEEDDDDVPSQNASSGATPPKKPRPDTRPTAIHRAGIAPTPQVPSAGSTQNGGGVGGGNTSISAQVAAAKARAQALMSAMQNKGSAPAPAPAPVRPPPPSAASTAPRSYPANAASNGTSAAAPTNNATARPAAAAAAAGASSIQAQLEAARAKVQAQMVALQAKNKPSTAPATAASTTATPRTTSSTSSLPATASSSKAPTAIHPLLLSNSLPSTTSSTSSTSSSYIKSRSIAPELNPYLQASRQAAEEITPSSGPKQRSTHKSLQFHKPGRHIREAEDLRREQQLEEIKKRIEESARKANAAEGIEEGDEKRLLRRAPPEVEWWDVNLLSARSYDSVPEGSVEQMLENAEKEGGRVLLYGKESPIDQYIQHPIPIPAPTEKSSVAPRGLMLTKKEQRKLRRQRRAAEQSDKRDRIKMGLLPPDPPKVKLSNLMRVLTSEAVSDPTKIEARVRREIAARKEAHERQNAERKLTDEQRREKTERKKEKEAEKGLFCAVFKVKHLISGRHKFKVRRNAYDHGLTGVTVFGRDMAVVVVEGSGKAIKAYKRLMLVRIDWSDPGESNNNDSDDEDGKKEQEGGNANNTPLGGGGGGGFRTLTTNEENVDWSTNTCELIFEGPIRERAWDGRGFRAIAAPNDEKAREILGQAGMQGHWDLAKRATGTAEDLV